MKKTAYQRLLFCLAIGLAVFVGLVTSTSAQAGDGSLTGKVLETMDSGGYTYLQIDTGSAKPWIAIPQSKVAVGEEVSCRPGMVMKNFSSKTLNRTFASIIFSEGLVQAAASPHLGPKQTNSGADSFASAIAAEGQEPQAHQVQAAGSGGSLGAITPFADISVDKAEGENGYRVGDIFSKKEALNGKTLRIRGQVVKFSPMIMGRNWIHLQDGSGDPTTNSHDLVITSNDSVKVGDTVTMEGVLAANKDFGAGYKYEAIVESAKVVQ